MGRAVWSVACLAGLVLAWATAARANACACAPAESSGPAAATRSAGLGLRGPQAGASSRPAQSKRWRLISGTRGKAALGPAPVKAQPEIRVSGGPYALPPASIAAPVPAASVAELRQRMDAAMRASAVLSDVPAVPETEAGAAGAVVVTVRVDVNRLPFHQHGRRFQDLYFIAALFSPEGTFVAGRQGEMDLALMPATWRRLAAEGLSAKLTLTAPPGSYRLRVVVGEFSDGALAASNQPVRIRQASIAARRH